MIVRAKNPYIILLFFSILFFVKTDTLGSILKETQLNIPENNKIFVLAVNCSRISKINIGVRVFFELSEISNIVAVHEGTVSETNSLLNYIKIKYKSSGHSDNYDIEMTYYGIDEHLVQEGSVIKRGQIIGVANSSFSIKVMINDVIVNVLERTALTQSQINTIANLSNY